jgi:hypothetical protein
MITENGLLFGKSKQPFEVKPKKDSLIVFWLFKIKMTPFAILSLIVIYFGILFAISHFSKRQRQ